VGAGFVESLARPGGGATGFTQYEYGMSGKWLTLGAQSSSSNPIRFDGTGPLPLGGTLNVQQITNTIVGNAFFGSDSGTYDLATIFLQTGPQSSGVFPVLPGPIFSTFAFSIPTVDFLFGGVTWNTIQDDTLQPTFSGTLTIFSLGGDAAFLAAFANPTALLEFTTTSLVPVRTLDQLAVTFETGFGGLASGRVSTITPVPGPIAGAGLPGLILACGVLLALARHRHKKRLNISPTS